MKKYSILRNLIRELGAFVVEGAAPFSWGYSFSGPEVGKASERTSIGGIDPWEQSGGDLRRGRKRLGKGYRRKYFYK
jgi:hypothetical protein